MVFLFRWEVVMYRTRPTGTARSTLRRHRPTNQAKPDQRRNAWRPCLANEALPPGLRSQPPAKPAWPRRDQPHRRRLGKARALAHEIRRRPDHPKTARLESPLMIACAHHMRRARQPPQNHPKSTPPKTSPSTPMHEHHKSPASRQSADLLHQSLAFELTVDYVPVVGGELTLN